MLRSIRIPILASFVALSFVACGGGSTKPTGQKDGGQQDGNHIQFDAQHDGLPPQQDGSGQEDGPAGGCVATGGVSTAGICKASKPCTCPLDCATPGGPTLPGSCFPIYNGTACDSSTDAPIQYQGETNPHCYPTGSLAGSFSVPIGTQTTAAGTITGMSITINGQSFAPTKGWAQHNTSKSQWEIALYSETSTNINAIYITVPDANYVTTTAVTFGNSGTGNIQMEVAAFNTSGTMTSDTMYGADYSGSMTLTQADTGTTGTVAGSFTSVVIYGAVVEFCGTNSAPC